VPPKWIRVLRELLLGLFGFPGDGALPETGWLRWAMIGSYVAIGVVIILIAVAALAT
jgi:hypothetical protein